MFFKNTEDQMELWDKGTDGQSNVPLLHSLPIQRTCDYVLVANKVDDDTNQRSLRQSAFLEELKKKNIAVTEIKFDEKIFFGLRVPSEILENYQYLLKVSDSCNCCREDNGISQANKIRIVNFILNNTFINTGENLEELMRKDVFETMFCLHEKKDQKNLQQKWARWSALFKEQPFDDIKYYFGEKVALYYLWLSWYTKLLIPAAAVGVVIFLYALAFFNTSPLIKEVCDSNITMCPRCDGNKAQSRCKAWQLSDTCTYAKVSHLFDNEGTVAFAMFMAIWATFFLELWKRHRATYVSKWNVYDWCEEEEELIMKIVNDPNCQPKEFRHSYLRSTLVLILVTVMLMLIIGVALAIVVFRVVAAPSISKSEWKFMKDHASTLAVMLGAVLHYVTMQIMTR
ncbi:hypothetical protein AMECASPLE_013729, partial [Ameca splendens]